MAADDLAVDNDTYHRTECMKFDLNISRFIGQRRFRMRNAFELDHLNLPWLNIQPFEGFFDP
jgi:hypothetical protein